MQYLQYLVTLILLIGKEPSAPMSSTVIDKFNPAFRAASCVIFLHHDSAAAYACALFSFVRLPLNENDLVTITPVSNANIALYRGARLPSDDLSK